MKSPMYHLSAPARVRIVAVLLMLGGMAAPLARSAQGADKWIDISSALVARQTNNGAKAAWPGGCSGVVENRTNGDVTIKVVGLSLW